MTVATGEVIAAADIVNSILKTGMIIIWTGTIANIPTGFVICDGNNSTPNLLGKFVEGVATAATNPGTTGGGSYKTTDTCGTGIIVQGSGGNANVALAHSHVISDARPAFYDVAYIMKT
jgi:hypothetical protein